MQEGPCTRLPADGKSAPLLWSSAPQAVEVEPLIATYEPCTLPPNCLRRAAVPGANQLHSPWLPIGFAAMAYSSSLEDTIEAANKAHVYLVATPGALAALDASLAGAALSVPLTASQVAQACMLARWEGVTGGGDERAQALIQGASARAAAAGVGRRFGRLGQHAMQSLLLHLVLSLVKADAERPSYWGLLAKEQACLGKLEASAAAWCRMLELSTAQKGAARQPHVLQPGTITAFFHMNRSHDPACAHPVTLIPTAVQRTWVSPPPPLAWRLAC